MLRYIIIALMVAAIIPVAESSECRVANQEGKQTHSICTIEGKEFHLLDIHGPMESLAYYHGKFLAPLVRKGVLQSVLDRRDSSLEKMPKKERAQFESVYSCIMSRYKRSVTDDLISEFRALAKGVRASGVKVSDDEIIEASLMVELSGFVDALMLEMEQNKTQATLNLFSKCGLHLSAGAAMGLLKKLASPLKNMKRGCTGFVASKDYTNNERHLHGRNFDTGFLGVFEKYPVILRHTPSYGVTYMGMSTAGLHYSGGISGMNEAGISISTHELRTTNYRTLYPLQLDLKPFNGKLFKRKQALTAPYLANKILKEAKSIDEAQWLVKKYGSFGAWSFLVSDAKTGEAASIEISGDVVRVAKRVKGHMGQTNHFIHSDTKKDNFEYSINKSLESRARLSLVETTLEKDKGAIDVNWGVELLSGHTDYYQGLRSFGRTVSKVYTSMSHVMDVKNNEFWFSVGNSYPTNLTNFVGLKIDFNPKHKDFYSFIDTVEAQSDLKAQHPNFVQSLHDYTMAYFAYTDKGDSVEGLKESLSHLEKAKSSAGLDDVSDFPTSIMISKLAIHLYAKTNDLRYIERAKEELEEIYYGTYAGLHTFEQSQVMEALGVSQYFLGDKEMAKKSFLHAKGLLAPLQKQFPGHFYLGKLVKEVEELAKSGPSISSISAHELHFATAE